MLTFTAIVLVLTAVLTNQFGTFFNPKNVSETNAASNTPPTRKTYELSRHCCSTLIFGDNANRSHSDRCQPLTGTVKHERPNSVLRVRGCRMTKIQTALRDANTKGVLFRDVLVVIKTETTKNGYTRSSNNHFRVQRKSSTRTPPGRPLIGRTTVVPGSGGKQSGCTRCAELMFRSTRYWLPLYPDLVRSVQATGRRAHTPTRARVHTRISE